MLHVLPNTTKVLALKLTYNNTCLNAIRQTTVKNQWSKIVNKEIAISQQTKQLKTIN